MSSPTRLPSVLVKGDVDGWQQPLGVLAVMQQVAVLPNVIFYAAVISACEKGQQWQQALVSRR